MKRGLAGVVIASLLATSSSWPYDDALTPYNLNTNQDTTDPLQYTPVPWPGHTYFPSPTNWRALPVYTLFLDRFVNGDPQNDNINLTVYEHDLHSTQMRHGGDVVGLVDTLDYLQGMGIKALYLAGTVLMNQPWGFDGYSALDTTLLDQHYGNITTWRWAIQQIHARGIYVIFDNTLATLGDLIGFEGYLNTTAPFMASEHQVQWKSDRQYVDFRFGKTYNKTCDYPRFWNDSGAPVDPYVYQELVGCYDSEFDQYGDIEAFGVFPDWQRELAKFASVQDRLREWVPEVRAKLKVHYCNIIASLDIDGFRFDKATQATVDALGDMSDYWRECAKKYNKTNFFLPGEITGGNTFGSVFLGRGRQTNDWQHDNANAITGAAAGVVANNLTSTYLRSTGQQAIDAAAFHYSFYRSLTRFLGMDGDLTASFDIPVEWVAGWNWTLWSNDYMNPNTYQFDPRHMYGTANQDVFRWPSIRNGTQKQLLGLFITTITLPGIPLILWGEEQGFYILDATAANYLYGRQSMSSATAWWTHGCFALGSTQYYQMPIDSARGGCHDITVTYDHRDPSHPIRNIMKHMFQLRDTFPALQDGWYLLGLSNHTEYLYYPGSNGTVTETGMWSVLRGPWPDIQNTTGVKPVWLIYQNDNKTVNYQFDCSSFDHSLIAPYPPGTTVKNLFYPFETLQLQEGPGSLFLYGSSEKQGCLPNITLAPWEFRAYVPADSWVRPNPMITGFFPGHDARIVSAMSASSAETLPLEIYFSTEMNCDEITQSITFNSTTESGQVAQLEPNSASCSFSYGSPSLIAEIPSAYVWRANVQNVYNGIHQLNLNNATDINGTSTNSVDHFLFRVGSIDNPMVFPTANYSTNLFHKYDNGTLYVAHQAAGADLWRYSTNWGSSYSRWVPYTGGNTTISILPWSGTTAQEWEGEHVTVEYFSKLTGSSDYVQEGDVDWMSAFPRHFPHLWWNGGYNEFGYDAGLPNQMSFDLTDGLWKFQFHTEWPAEGQINVWGMNLDGQPDQTFVYGDVDGDSVLDRLPPSSLSAVLINVTNGPPSPHLAWEIQLNDATLRFKLTPIGSQYAQMVLFFLLWIVPVVSAAMGVWIFMKSFYQVKFNQVGVSDKKGIIPLAVRRRLKRHRIEDGETSNPLMRFANKSGFLQSNSAFAGVTTGERRRMVLIATMEYDIKDWGIKIKIGGLGVMAQLMGEHLGHQDLIWVVPCVGGVEYPEDQPAEPMFVTVLGNSYEVQVQYHVLRNITYVLLDAPVFRQQTKTEPYPARMDDLDSAIYYSAWNQCIAQACKRFPIDLYHINDYHGSLVPLYLLPQTVPACLSLHNAEFQGLWPMRTQKEKDEVCSVFNIDVELATRYVQFGEVFNLLHAAASYLRIHQQGFGAVGVSRKYGKRSYARYPIFWGLKKVGNLPNPDPSDTGEWTRNLPQDSEIRVDPDFEQGRAQLKRQAQEWAGLDQNPDADLLVFVGRWSMQKGIDLIADVMPAVLETCPNVQLICVGPVIDLYGKFAALKLDRMTHLYPGRVYSKPQFTALPQFIFSGAEFALIPSRDEPFGLVAVEFGRQGALGIGARVGGLGQMPGWWYTVESTTTSHLLHQFKLAIDGALNSKESIRAMMRACSAKQRFPVAQWVDDLEILQCTAIRIHSKEATKSHGQPYTSSGSNTPSGMVTPPIAVPELMMPTGIHTPPLSHSRNTSFSNLRLSTISPQQRSTIVYSRDPSPGGEDKPKSGLSRQLSLGVRSGPGHSAHQRRGGRRLRKSGIPEADEVGVAVTDVEEDSDEEMIPSVYDDDEYTLTPEQAEANQRHHIKPQDLPSLQRDFLSPSSPRQATNGGGLPRTPTSPTTPATPHVEEALLPPGQPFALHEPGNRLSSASVLSVDSVIGDKKDFKLQKVDPFFTDSTGEFYRIFEKRLEDLNGNNSESQFCIEEYLIKSEKKWFERFRDARLGRNQSPAPSVFLSGKPSTSPAGSIFNEDLDYRRSGSDSQKGDEFLLGRDYVPPTGLRKWMQLRIGDWPVYSLFLGLGQIIAANSYQITLLTGEVGQAADKLYGIATTYLVSSILWWLVFRTFKSVAALSLPWFFYGLAFLMIAFAHYDTNSFNRGWLQNVASGIYAVASSSGSIFFALNFGDESAAPMKDWVFRACVIQGTQQIYVVALWYWGSVLAKENADGIINVNPITNNWVMTAITLPIAVLLWAIGLLLAFGLPDYYRQSPGKVPSFYKALFRRRIVVWFCIAVIIQNFFLSAPYGRNWSFLWSSQHVEVWQIVLLVVLFFVVIWIVFLFILSSLSKDHSWILPVFAIGLGAPRWAQIWWGTSNVGVYLPWVGSYTASALISRSLWLWLGILDAMQGVGFGMILLQTLTRMHICFVLLSAQVLGSIATICARAFAPNKIGPGQISPDIGISVSEVWVPWFWVALFFQLLICAGFFLFFRKEQLAKP